MDQAKKKLLVIQVAALGYELLRENKAERWEDLAFRPAETVFPALTCPVQATFRTAAAPAAHGVAANGCFHANLGKVLFWEQSSRLVAGERIWDEFRARGGAVAMLFWQQSLGESVDWLLSPAPIHKHHGGMVQDCYSLPRDLYPQLTDKIGPFRLRRYWGPWASSAVGDWIADATCQVLARGPGLCLTYLPSLDYDLQRFGPRHLKSRLALEKTRAQALRMRRCAESLGYDVLVFGDYAIAPARRAVLPNLALREAGLFAPRPVGKKLHPDFHASQAFAVVDHEIAHVHVRRPEDLEKTAAALRGLSGVEKVLKRPQRASIGIDHAHVGELVLLAEPGCWFAYPWWRRRCEAPDFAAHVDIHNKPGFDPCELFGEPFGWLPLRVGQDPGRVGGTHGRVGRGREIAWAATFEPSGPPQSVLNLAALVRDRLEEIA